MIIKFRVLNEKTIGDAYPLSNITEILDQLESAKYFSVFDLASGFHQKPKMYESDAKNSLFHSARALSIQSNAIRIKCTRHIPKTHGSGIIRITKVRYVRLFQPYCYLCVFPHRTLDKIQ